MRFEVTMLRNLKILLSPLGSRNFCAIVKIDDNLRHNFETQEFKPRKHPGRVRIKTASLPPDISNAIKNVLDDCDGKAYIAESEKLNNHLSSRLLPPEQGDIDEKAAEIYQKLTKKHSAELEKAIGQEKQKIERKIQTKTFNALKTKVYSWGNINFDKPTALQYLIARAAPEYAVLIRILDDIRLKFPDYQPRSFFDFGSGIGTGTWAVNHYWKGNIFEYFCVDTSSVMNDLARLILCNGRENTAFPFKGYFQRQFLPASSDLKYNLVLSAYSLLELPNIQSRLETIQKLWKKTEDFLIIVEQGTNAGFKAVNEAREYILNLPKGSGYAFSPCPNDSICPRYLEHETPCNFLMKYQPLQYGCKTDIAAELFTYVILKKGKRPSDDPQWPRLVRPPIVRSGHTICRLCTSQGELKEIIFTKSKHDQNTYRCARSSNWGDLLPVKQ